MNPKLLVVACACVALIGLALPASATIVDPVISSNEPLPFPRDSENEPSLALDRSTRQTAGPLLVAGGNDYRDQPACRDSSSCGFRTGVGVSGVYTSSDATTWTTGTYGTIRTLPKFKKSLWSFGDAAVAAGPRPVTGKPGAFSWSAPRFYYATLAARTTTPERVITVSFADAPPAWSAPRIISRGYFSDRPAIWADNASGDGNSRFGDVYVCWTWFKSVKETEATDRAGGFLALAASTDGGLTWPLLRRFSPSPGYGAHGCSIRSDSAGGVSLFWEERRVLKTGAAFDKLPDGTPCAKLFSARIMTRTWAPPAASFGPPELVAKVNEPGAFDSAQERCTADGVAGARVNGWPSPDIANGAPAGHATNATVVAWADGDTVKAVARYGSSGTWSAPADLLGGATGDHPAFPAVALSPDGTSIYLVYNAFLQEWQKTVVPKPRLVQGVVRTTSVKVDRRSFELGRWGEARGAPGDARGAGGFGLRHGSEAGVAAEFLGDYNAIVATNDGAYAAWTDVSAAADCGAVDQLRTGYVKKNGVAPGFRNLDGKCDKDALGRRFGNTTLCSVKLPKGTTGTASLKRFCEP